MKKYLYSYKKGKCKNKNKLFFQQLKNSWDIDEKNAEKYLKENKIEFKQYSDKHFDSLYNLINEKISNMNTEEKTLYIEYRKIRLDNIKYKEILLYLITFFIGGSFNGFIVSLTNNDIYSIIMIIIAVLFIMMLYLCITISPKDKFNYQIIAAIEKSINEN